MIRTLQPMLGILLVYTLLLLATNLLFALNGNLLSWTLVRLYYHEIAFFMLYGIGVTVPLFWLLKEDGKQYSKYLVLGGFIVVFTYLLNDFSLFVYTHSPVEDRLTYNHYQLAIWVFILLATTIKTQFFRVYKPLTFFGFIMIAFLSGALPSLVAYWSDISNGKMVFSWDLIFVDSIELLTCCLAMYVVCKTTLIASETNMSPKLNLPIVLKAWFIVSILIHLFLAVIYWKTRYYPELNGLFFHLCIVVGLCLLLFDKRIGWPLFYIPMAMLLLVQGRILLNILIRKEIFNYIYLDYSPLEFFILAVEFFIAWYFVKRKQIKQ